MRHSILQLIIILLLALCGTKADAQIITTIAGRLKVGGLDSFGHSGNGGPASAAVLNVQRNIFSDTAGNIYTCGYEGVRRIDAVTGIITQIAGGGVVDMFDCTDTIPATDAHMEPWGVCIDTSGGLLVTDALRHRIIRVNLSTGYFSTVAGTCDWMGYYGSYGDGGPATAAKFKGPKGMALDAAQNLYVVDNFNATIRRIDAATGIITTIAGNGSHSYGGDGGPAIAARFNDPLDICFDAAGDMYISDAHNYRVRKIIMATGIISTFAGTGATTVSGLGGPATLAGIGKPGRMVFDDTGNLYVSYVSIAVSGIMKINAGTGIITHYAGGGMAYGAPGYPGDGLPATSAYLNTAGMCFDTCGNMYVAESSRVRKISNPYPCTWPDTTGGGDTVVTPVSVAAVGNSLRVYPNPAHEQLQISGTTGTTTYRLTGITGITLKQGALHPATNSINIADCPPGIYILELTCEGGERNVVRVMKE